MARFELTIRKAKEEDTAGIVQLLKISLGELLMPKSEALWRWKHIENPFGRSPVLIACDGDRIVAVRAFMRWEWDRNGEMIRAVRAVDTATHPDYTGKGLFSALTLDLVQECKQEGVDLIFNTPNRISKPGYLKMGWRSLGRLPVMIRPRIAWIRRDPRAVMKRFNSADVTELSPSPGRFMQTRLSQKYLRWRYNANPNIEYQTITFEPDIAAVFRLKHHGYGTEFRVCECLHSHKKVPGFREKLLHTFRGSGASHVTWSGFELPLVAPAFKVGPEVTILPISEKVRDLSFANWKPTLGDLEVF